MQTKLSLEMTTDSQLDCPGLTVIVFNVCEYDRIMFIYLAFNFAKSFCRKKYLLRFCWVDMLGMPLFIFLKTLFTLYVFIL